MIEKISTAVLFSLHDYSSAMNARKRYNRISELRRAEVIKLDGTLFVTFYRETP